MALGLAAVLWASSLAAQDLAVEAHRGKRAMADGRFADAAAIYEKLVRALPDEPGMRLNLGMALSMDGRIREAMPHLQRAVELRPALVPGWLFLGANWLELGEPAKAITALRKVLSGEPANVRARELLGEALLSLGRYESAAAEFHEVTEQAPQAARGWYGLGRAYEGLARAAFDALERDGGSAYALALRADALAASRQTEAANQLYERARRLAPELHDTLRGVAPLDCAPATSRTLPDAAGSHRAACEFYAGRHAELVRIFKTEPTATARYWLTRAYNELAREAFGALTGLPPSPEAHQFRAELLRRQGRHEESAEQLRRAIQLAPGDARLERELASSLYLAKSYEAALELLEKIADRDRSAETLFLLGDTLLIVGRAPDAVKVLEQVVQLQPALLGARASLGRAYLQTGDAAAAIPHLEAAMKGGEDEDGSLYYQLARAYQATGQPELARKMLDMYAAIQKKMRRQ